MRLVPVLLAVLLLAGCAQDGQGGGAAPSGTPPVDAARLLENGFWSVSGADEPASTRVRFGAASVDVFRKRGVVLGELAMQDDQLLASFSGWSMSLGDDHEVPWLEAAATVDPTGHGVRLLDAAGAEVATLRRADAPPPSDQYETDPTPPAGGTRSPDVVPGAEAVDLDAAAVTCRWRLAGTDAALQLEVDGDWRATTSCESGTGAAGGAGRYRVIDGGAVLVTAGPVAAVGCSEPSFPPSPDAAAIADFWRAGSLALDGDRLTVYGRDGQPLGSLVR